MRFAGTEILWNRDRHRYSGKMRFRQIFEIHFFLAKSQFVNNFSASLFTRYKSETRKHFLSVGKL